MDFCDRHRQLNRTFAPRMGYRKECKLLQLDLRHLANKPIEKQQDQVFFQYRRLGLGQDSTGRKPHLQRSFDG